MEADPQRMSRHVKRAWPELQALFAAGDAVSELLEHAGWACLVSVLEEDVAEIDDRLGRWREPLSQAEYAGAHGRRGGLLAVREAAHAIVAYAEARLAEQREQHERTAEPVSGRQ